MRWLGLVFLFSAAAGAADRLPGYAADLGALTVSGLSSGGYMAGQFHIAHSSTVRGAGMLAAGPYYCAQGSSWSAYYRCTTPGYFTPLPKVEDLKAQLDKFAREGGIDATANLAGAPVWLFSGTKDHTVEEPVVAAAERLYALLGAKPVFVKDRPAGHGMATLGAGNACGSSESPFINGCEYDAAGQLLHHLTGSPQPAAATASGGVIAFDQRPFADGNAHAIGMADEGYAYVPAACETQSCRVHVAFHGCRQNAGAVGERFVREAGYNRWADTNAFVVLYPQAIKRYSPLVFNPRGCWDWWGYTGAEYHTQRAPQIRAVMAMLDRLAQ
jgi:poly(3-hydroxybutyrate) depolymerase